MRYIGVVIVLGILAYVFFGDSGEAKPDLRNVLNRAAIALEKFDKYMKDNKIEKATDEHMNQLSKYMQTAMNTDPKFYTEGLIAMKLQKDAKFEGYNDANKNGEVDSGEKKIFHIEVDSANKRLIATDASGTSVGRGLTGLATGFLAGAIMSNLLSRQSAAGIRPDSFNNRKVTPASSYARGRSSSGGRFGGK